MSQREKIRKNVDGNKNTNKLNGVRRLAGLENVRGKNALVLVLMEILP